MAIIEPRQVQALMDRLAQIPAKYLTNFVAQPQNRFRYRNAQHSKVFRDMPTTTRLGNSN